MSADECGGHDYCEPDVDALNEDLLNLFIAALTAEPAELTLLKELIGSNQTEFQRFSPVLLRTAIFQSFGSTDILKLLLDFGADANRLHEGKHCLVRMHSILTCIQLQTKLQATRRNLQSSHSTFRRLKNIRSKQEFERKKYISKCIYH